MSQISSKVCIVGDFAVGKTSLVERYVNQQFSEKYLTTVGVKIDTKEIESAPGGVHHKLIIWDVAGADRFGATEFAYLRGASGLIFVADGTRSGTLRSVEYLRNQIVEQYGESPRVLLVNKSDLDAQWEITDQQLADLAPHYAEIYRTSAKTGAEVETAILDLAARILANDIGVG